MSPRRYRIAVAGKTYEVEVGDLSSSPVTVNVDGVDYDVEVPQDGSPSAVPVARPTPAGPPAQRPAAPPRPAVPTDAGDGTIRALMPGRIISVNVGPGDTVTAGQAVLVVESMKMENIITAPADGTVRAVHVGEGDTVQHGQTLIELD